MTTLMAAEIAEQPAALRRTLTSLLPRVPEIAALSKGHRLMFIARGSSDNAAIYGRYLSEARCGRPAAMASPSVATTYQGHPDLHGVLAVALSQSGRTAEVTETLCWAREHRARTIAITNDARSPLATVADITLATEAGAERAIPATKTYSTQLAALAVLSLALLPGADFRAELCRAPDEADRLLGCAPEAAALAEQLAPARTIFVSGRGYSYSTALELALKLQEACYIPALGFSQADLLHGPIAAVGRESPVILCAPGEGRITGQMLSLARKVQDSGGRPYCIGGDRNLVSTCTSFLPGPGLSEPLSPLALCVPAQLFTEALARRLGCNPDQPEGLTKITQS